MFPKTLRLGYYSKEAAIFYYIYLKKSLIEKCFKCPEEKKEKILAYWQYTDFCHKVLKANIKGFYTYFYGWRYGIDGITLIIRNKETKLFGELLQGFSEEKADRELEEISANSALDKIARNHRNLYVFYWGFGHLHNNIKKRINHIYLRFENYDFEDFSAVLEAVLDLLKDIREKIEEWSEKNVYQAERECSPGAYEHVA